MLKSCISIAVAYALCLHAGVGHAATPRAGVKAVVDSEVRPFMGKDGIPGVAVGLVVDGRSYVFNYGVASRATHQPVTDETLFELGSVSKAFTATLAALAQSEGVLSLADPVEKYLPALHGSAFGKTSLLELATHTTGGLPLQVPNAIHDDAQLLRYLKTWQTACQPGTCRQYTNIGIGVLGLIVAKIEGKPFAALMRAQVLGPLGMSNTWYAVPPARMPDYAEGYTSDGKPIRMAPGVLDAEAYGVRTTASDMLCFIRGNLGLPIGDARIRRALVATHTGYFKAGVLMQDLIWEQYPYPVSLQALQQGNSSQMIFDATPARRIEPPLAPQPQAWINKTGSTNGFAAYVAFVPSKKMGIVLLANKSLPISDRIKVAHAILTKLDSRAVTSGSR